MDTFSGSACIRFGWETFKKRVWFFVGITALVGILSAISSGIGSSFGHDGSASALGSIISFVLGAFISMCAVAFFLKAHDAPESVKSNDLWYPEPYLKFLAVKLLAGAAVVIGVILLIVPGVIFGLMFMFAPYIVVDRGMGPLEAMAESKRITRGHKWALLGFGILMMLLNILGAVCLLVGLLVTVPVTALAVTHAYRTLSRAA
jgi:uncharacterized membrane protein